MSEPVADIVVIGAGPGGYPAAFAAADHGLSVTLVNAEPAPGGVCLQRGCIPSKALLHVAKLINEAKDAKECGLTFGKPKIDLDKLRGFKESVIGSLTGGIGQLCKARGVNLVEAYATFVDSNTLELAKPDGSKETLRFKHAIVATGSSPTMPPFFDLGDERVMDSTGALELEDIPESLLVVGGGYIGLEMGTVYAELGSRVSVVELTDSLLPGADRDLVKPLHKRLGNLFEAIRLNTKVTGLKDNGKGVDVSFEGPEGQTTETFSRVLVAVGRRPNSDGIGLENTDVVMDSKGFVEVDKQQRTADSHMLAIGDVCGEPMLAHRASHQGKVAVESLHGEPALFEPRAIPAVVFTDPEIAWAGLTEQEAELSGREIEVSRYPWAASGRAHALGRIEGMTKMLVDPETEQVLGVGIVGSGAGELIAEGALAIEMGCTARDLSETIHPHPTLGETVAFSAENYFGLATEIFRPRAASSAR